MWWIVGAYFVGVFLVTLAAIGFEVRRGRRSGVGS